MTHSTQIINWLATGFEQSVGNMTELFYYDKRDQMFFSVLFTDYFMLDLDMNIANDVTHNYSSAAISILLDKMKRIENNDPDIISVPRVELDDRKRFMKEFVDTLSDQNLMDLLNQRIQNQDYRTRFDFYFGNEADELTKQKWEAVKSNFLRQQVDSFLNLNDIDIDKATLWIPDTTASISIKLTQEK